MIYLFWSLPVLAVVLLVGSGRASSVAAAGVGAALAVAVALLAAPVPFGPADAAAQAARGAWLAWLVAAVILGGLFFKEAASPAAPPSPSGGVPVRARRGRLFSTCFLVGPFAEAATGFGVGQVAAAAAMRPLGLADRNHPARKRHFGCFRANGLRWETAAPRGWLEGDPGIYAVHFDGADDPRVAQYAAEFEDGTGKSRDPESYQMYLLDYASRFEKHGFDGGHHWSDGDGVP